MPQTSFKACLHQCKREGFVQKVKEERGEGCNIYGSLEVNKVAGNFHFSPGKSFHYSNFHLQDLLSIQNDIYNVRVCKCTSFPLLFLLNLLFI